LSVLVGPKVPDFGRELRFGYFLVPNADDPLVATAERVEQLGLDCIGVQDHPYQRRYVDTWALLAALAASSSRVTLFPDVANLPLRSPVLLAKAAATIDRLSSGRFELGLGAGAFWDAIEALGGPRRTPKESLDALVEAADVIRKIWSGEKGLRVDGRFYSLHGAHGGPEPAHQMDIWFGAYGPRALRLTARLADGWVPSFRGQLQPLFDMTARLDDAAADVGRDPGDLRRILNVGGTITNGATQATFRGPPEHWAELLTALAVDHGFDTFLLWADGHDQLPRFAEEVAPTVRDAVARTRRSGP
jgi:alkanesulfonate monooxygenase SsuD/methylene tetrahydromethanopterin reductase-like flavin-dependent oxidoreductase (luciferase family)